MRIFKRKTLVDFWEKHRGAEEPLRYWFSIAEKASWLGPADIKAAFRSVDFIANDRAIFNIGGNSYRLVAHVRYARLGAEGMIYVRFIGTHAEYDRIDAKTI